MEFPTYALTQGPLPKSIYTYQLEDLTRKLMSNIDYNINDTSQGVCISFKDGSVYNFDKILKLANLSHLSFTSDDFNLYRNYHDKLSKRHSLLQKSNLPNLQRAYADLDESEMHAINIYTQDYYTDINALLRGQYQFNQKDKRSISDVIIHAVMCGSALSRIPDEKIETCYRGEVIYDKALHDKRINSSKTGQVTALSGFVSTSTNYDLASEFMKTLLKKKSDKGAFFEFSNLIGKNIHGLSIYKENEFLIPPTQIQITDFQQDGNNTYFKAQTVRDLALVQKESLLQRNTIDASQIVLNELEEYLLEQIKNTQEHKSYFFVKKRDEKLQQLQNCGFNLMILKSEVQRLSENPLNISSDEKLILVNKIDKLIQTTIKTCQVKTTLFHSKSQKNTGLCNQIKHSLMELKSIHKEDLNDKPSEFIKPK